MDGCLVIKSEPELLAPYLLVGFRGWLNAAEVSIGCIEYLRSKLGARTFGHIEPRGFYVYQIPGVGQDQGLRPHTKIEGGVIKTVEPPQNEFSFWRSGTGHDLILLSGVEPHMEWTLYAQAILDAARRFGAVRIYALGSVFDQVPHTRQTSLYAVVNDERLREEVGGIAPLLNYEGPCSFTTMLFAEAARQGMGSIGITARTPLYIQDFNTKTSYDLLRSLSALIRIEIDLDDLRLAGEGLTEIMDKSFRENRNAREQLRTLEEKFDAALPEIIGPGHGDDYDKLMEEVLRMKRTGRKPH